MSYATIEEAWGGFGKQQRQPSPAPSPAPTPTPKPKPSPPAATTFEEGQKYVRAVYARHGIGGVLELLGEDISRRLCGKKRRRRREGVEPPSRNVGGNSWFDLTPEKTLLLVIILLGAFALLDGFSISPGPRGSSSSPPPW